MAQQDPSESGAAGSAGGGKRPLRSVIAAVVVLCAAALAVALHGIVQSESVAAPATSTGYFPDGYVNRAAGIEPLPPTF